MRIPSGVHAESMRRGRAASDSYSSVSDHGLTMDSHPTHHGLHSYASVTTQPDDSRFAYPPPPQAADLRRSINLRLESARTPNASRAGALHSHIHIHSQRQNYRPKAASMTSGRGLARLMDGRFAGVEVGP